MAIGALGIKNMVKNGGILTQVGTAALKIGHFQVQQQDRLLISGSYNNDTNNGYFMNWMPHNMVY